MTELPKNIIQLASVDIFSALLGLYRFGETKLRILPTSTGALAHSLALTLLKGSLFLL